MTRSQLYYTHYEWKAKEEDEDLDLRGFSSRALLARKEGYEVLGFINHLAQIDRWVLSNEPRDPETKQRIPITGHKVELMLHFMPPAIRTRQEAHKWLLTNWAKY